MPIITSWDNPGKTIIRHIFDGRWTALDALGAIEQGSALQDEVPYVVDFIGDFTRPSYFIPADLTLVFRHLETMYIHRLQYPSYTVGIQVPPFLRSLIKIMDRITPDVTWHIFYVSTDEEAYALLATKRGRPIWSNPEGDPTR